MYCRNCGGKIENPNAYVCLHCGGLVNPVPPQRPKFYSAGFVLGILSLCIPMHGLFLGIIGLPLACLAKRKSAIILNCIGILLWLSLIAFMIVGATQLFETYHLEFMELQNIDYYFTH